MIKTNIRKQKKYRQTNLKLGLSNSTMAVIENWDTARKKFALRT